MDALNDGLNDLGRRQAQLLGDRLRRYGVGAVYSSTLRRAAETAEIIADVLDRNISWDPRLCEGDFGDCASMMEDEVKAKYRNLWEGLERGIWVDPPGGETPAQLQERVVAVVQEVAAARAGQSLLLVSHWGALASYISHVLSLDVRSGQRSPVVLDHCSLSIVDFDGPGPVLQLLNDTCHLDVPG